MTMEAGNSGEVNWLNPVVLGGLSLFNNCVGYLNNIRIMNGNGKCLCVPVAR